MVKIGKYLPIVILICVRLAFATADAQENLAQQVSAIFQQSCLNCHGPSGSFKEALLLDRNALIDTQVVIPGNPENSEFYKRLLGPTENGPQMPLNLPPLSPEAIETIARWITAGAPDWDVQHDINFITTDTILDTIRNHLESLDPFDRPSARYFTMTHLYNAGETPETLSDYRIALSKLVNSLSWKFEITNPTPIDEAQTIFYIDLRRYEWNNITTDVWTQIEQVYPYNIAFDPETQEGLLEKLTHLQTETGSTVPFVHVDWFLATASLPPLYHDILGLPQTDRVLEAQLEVNVASNIRNAPGIDVWRAGFNDSGVSSNNRVVERHTSRYGAYWKSYDFAGSVGSQNIFTHPLDFTHDGGEIIFNLPNGLQAYLLVDANGVRLDDAPIKIVSNPAASDPTVRNGLSCIGCHTQGMKKFEDSVRAAIEQDNNPPYNKEHALRLYPEQAVLDALVVKDTVRFQQALEKIGGPFADDASRQRFFKQHENEPIQRFHELFQMPLDDSHAAAAVGLETAEFLTQIREKQSLKNLGLQTLIDENGTVKRDAWTSNFDDVISALNTPDSVLPPVERRPELIPGESVDIPDPNLRAAIEAELGKAAGDTITAVEMAELNRLVARDRDIQNLTGLQLAIHLNHLSLSGNQISDLSPITGLTELKKLWLNGNPISDLSPLKHLTNLTILQFDNTHVSDLSPLAGLINLDELGASTPLISDLSPLKGLKNLRILWFHRTQVSDLSPLAGLTHLEDIAVNQGGIFDAIRRIEAQTGIVIDTEHGNISDLSPLAGLINLRRVWFWGNPITDLSPLSGLTKLEKVDICGGTISDLKPLVGLTNLTGLFLAANGISDISPLAQLTSVKNLDLRSNKISDISPLAGLTHLNYLRLNNNNISDFSPLDAIRQNITLIWHDNPGFPKGGPKIEGPWLWVVLPDADLESGADLLAQASDGRVTETEIATHGATAGASVGSHIWTSHKLPENGRVEDMLEPPIPDGIIYGCVSLYSLHQQETTLGVGSRHELKVWFNGDLIHEQGHFDRNARDYNDFYPVTLQPGRNALLVAFNSKADGFFGFETGTEYTVSDAGIGYSLPETAIHIGDTFTVELNAENVSDLAGWQFDISFDATVLEAVEVKEGDFLKAGGSATFFQEGTIDNTTGKITGLSSARLSEGGATGTGTLLSVTFAAKTMGEARLVLHNFELGSITGEHIAAESYEVVITIEGQLTIGDVNRDGRVSILDLVLVAQHFGKTVPANSEVDMNGDGIINVLDLILVSQNMGKSTASASPSILATDDIDGLDPAMIQAWIEKAQVEDDGSIVFQQGIANLQRLLASLIPEKTMLLANYPNPFNPETWIPYQLANPSDVQIIIYDTRGAVVRRLELGNQRAAHYTSRSRAAYWDGRNAVGERVASGVYYYQLQADNLSLLRKMVILK